LSVIRRLDPLNEFLSQWPAATLRTVPAHLVPLDGDWHAWVDPSRRRAPASLRVRVAEGDDGRLHVVDLHVEGVVSAEVLRSIPIGRIEAAANGQLHASARQARPRRASATIAARLHTNPVRGYPDAFYAAVASAYRALATSSPRPVADLADANGVPVTTAQRWVKEARRRGLLAPGPPGKAG
jgi:hypothetical protein